MYDLVHYVGLYVQELVHAYTFQTNQKQISNPVFHVMTF
jgi:hypothetical protein